MSLAVLVWCVLAEDKCIHWFVVPLVLCGTLIGIDLVKWARGQLDPLDPAGLIGLLGFHFFFLAPLLHVCLSAWITDLQEPPDLREWLGRMAIWNVFGLVAYRLAREYVASRPDFQGRCWRWVIDRRQFWFIVTLTLALAGLVQCWVYWRYGGLDGYMQTYFESGRHYGTTDPSIGFAGMGWIFTISESFPLLAMMGFVTYANAKRRFHVSWPTLFIVLTVLFFLLLLFGGLRGSRSNIVWYMFWAVGIIHFCVRRLTRTAIYVAVPALVFFMYFYAFYKHSGSEVLKIIQGAGTWSQLQVDTNQTIEFILLRDLARSDVQTSALYELTGTPRDYKYALGRTYLGALALLIPRSIWSDRPPTKVAWTTELETGGGSYQPGVWQSSHVYGLAGEAMLNFGPAAVPIAFGIFGLLVGGIRLFLFRLGPGDARFLIAPLLILLSLQLLVNDSDVNLFFLVKFGSVPFAVVFLSSCRVSAYCRPNMYKAKRYFAAPLKNIGTV